jgi:hypothetical protein
MNLAIDLCSTEDSECELSEDDEIFARKLQKEFDAEHASVEEFECPVCLDEKTIESKFIYQNCGHVQCRDCASDFFIRQIELKKKINCVLCQKEVSILDLELVLSTDLVRKYLKTHNIEAQYEEHNGDDGNDVPIPTYYLPKKPVKTKPAKRPTSKVLAPPAKKIAKKAPVRHNIHNTIESNKSHPSFLDQEYVPGNTEPGKSYNAPHTRYDDEF